MIILSILWQDNARLLREGQVCGLNCCTDSYQSAALLGYMTTCTSIGPAGLSLAYSLVASIILKPIFLLEGNYWNSERHSELSRNVNDVTNEGKVEKSEAGRPL